MEKLEPVDRDSWSNKGPCRAYAKTILAERIHNLESKLAGLKALHKIAEKLENGSDAENALWAILQRGDV